MVCTQTSCVSCQSDAVEDAVEDVAAQSYVYAAAMTTVSFPSATDGFIIGYVRGEDGVPQVPAAPYQLCATGGGGAPVYGSFGTVTLLGPVQVAFACVLGVECAVVVTGTGMPDTASVAESGRRPSGAAS